MAFDRQAGGHAFDFDRGVCVKCGMTREAYQDNGFSLCQTMRTSSEKQKEKTHLIVDDDE
jgi:hypothetical protein